MKKLSFVFIFVAFLTLQFICFARATVYTYHNKADFLQDLLNLGIPHHQALNFENQTVGHLIMNGDTVSGITFNYSIFNNNIQVGNSFGTTSPDNSIGLNNIEQALIYGDSLTIKFNQTIQAIGLYIIAEPGTVFANDFELSTTTGSAFNSNTPDAILSDGEAFFIGLIVSEPEMGFSAAQLTGTQNPADVNYVFNLDDITTTLKYVPLPAIFLLLLSY